MATWYYLSKISKNKTEFNFKEYFNELYKIDPISYKRSNNVCRVCLQKGKIFLLEEENKDSDLLRVLHILTDIQIREDDEYPKLLCETCSDFVKIATQFRKIAKRTDELLKNNFQEEKVAPDCNFIKDHDNHDAAVDDDLPETEFNDIKIETKDKPKYSQKVTCNVCNKIVNRSYIKEHMTIHDQNHQKYVCEVCGKSFRLRCAYYNHSLRHRKDFPFKCQFCPYRGRYSELLKNHMRTHTGDYRYVCTDCPARFLFKSNLNSHMLKHKIPQFKCDTCKRAFHTKLKFQRHFDADHLGIKNHVCSVCGKAFGYRNAMLKHERLVHKREKSTFSRMPSYLQAENTYQHTIS